MIVVGPQNGLLLVLLIILGALAFGVLFVLPIGGADMPVVISLLNAFTGVAAAATGFVLHQNVADRQRDARRRVGHAADADDGAGDGPHGLERLLRRVRRSCQTAAPRPRVAPTAAPCARRPPEDVGVMLAYADRVIIVPGYGLAVAQAQHAVRELADELEKRGVDVRYAIHPVAGRMPGHMNVLLAEANVPYDAARRDGRDQPGVRAHRRRARDRRERRRNPAARLEPGSPIYGMPILDVDKAQNVVVLKRSMRPGFAGVDNPLFYDPKTQMLFGDAKSRVEQLVAAVKAV